MFNNRDSSTDLILELANGNGSLIYIHKFILQMRCPMLLNEILNSTFKLDDGVTASAFLQFLDYLYYDCVRNSKYFHLPISSEPLGSWALQQLQTLAIRYKQTRLSEVCFCDDTRMFSVLTQVLFGCQPSNIVDAYLSVVWGTTLKGIQLRFGVFESVERARLWNPSIVILFYTFIVIFSDARVVHGCQGLL